jgi:hypothetical protein
VKRERKLIAEKVHSFSSYAGTVTRMHPPMGSRYDFALSWSRNWFAGIGHNEMNPATLALFSSFWSSEYTAVQKGLEVAVKTSRRLFDFTFIKRRFFNPWNGG